MTAIESREIRGITLKVIIVIISCTGSMVAGGMTCFFELKGAIANISSTQETTNRVNEIRLKVLEGQVSLLQAELHELKDNKKS